MKAARYHVFSRTNQATASGQDISHIRLYPLLRSRDPTGAMLTMKGEPLFDAH